MKRIVYIIFFWAVCLAGCATTATKGELSSYASRTFYLRRVTFNDFQTGGGFKTPQLDKKEVARLFANLPLGEIQQYYKKQYNITVDTTRFRNEIKNGITFDSLVGKSTWDHPDYGSIENGIEIHLGLKLLSSTKLSFSGIETRIFPLRTYTMYLFADGKRKSVDSNSFGVIEPPAEDRNLKVVKPLVSKAGTDADVFRKEIKNHTISTIFNTELVEWLEEKAGTGLTPASVSNQTEDENEDSPTAGLNEPVEESVNSETDGSGTENEEEALQ